MLVQVLHILEVVQELIKFLDQMLVVMQLGFLLVL